MLLLRLHHFASLSGGVRHILVESNTTFSGKTKPLHFRERDAADPAFAPFLGKIEHIVVPQPSDSDIDPWHRERDQRNAMLRAESTTAVVAAAADDLFMVSDVDEIPRLETLETLLFADENPCRSGVTCHVESQMYYYSLQHKVTTERWLHPDIMSVADAKAGTWTPQSLRDKGFQIGRRGAIPDNTANILQQGGWHLSYFGTPEDILEKIHAFSHQEYNVPSIADLASIRETRRLGVDPLRRAGQNLSVAQSCDLRDIPDVLRAMPWAFGFMAPHCPTARPACWKHLESNMQSTGGVLTFDSARDYIKGGVGGGLTNQIAGIANGLTIARTLDIPVVVPSAFSRISWQMEETEALQYRRVPFAELFDERALLDDRRVALDVCVLSLPETQQLLARVLPRSAVGAKLDIVDVLSDLREANKRYLKPQALAALAHLPKHPSKLFEYALGATSDLLWVTSEDGSAEFARMLLTETISFAPDIRKAADRVRLGLDHFGQGYSALHLRLDENDAGAFAEVDGVLEKAANALHTFPRADILYVASGKSDPPVLAQLGVLVSTPITRKELLEPTLMRELEKIPEKLAAVDFMICSMSRSFVGFSQSTFSALVRLRHGSKKKEDTKFYDRPQPPWQVILSIDASQTMYQFEDRERISLDYPSHL